MVDGCSLSATILSFFVFLVPLLVAAVVLAVQSKRAQKHNVVSINHCLKKQYKTHTMKQCYVVQIRQMR